jgi:hypothetical protein
MLKQYYSFEKIKFVYLLLLPVFASLVLSLTHKRKSIREAKREKKKKETVQKNKLVFILSIYLYEGEKRFVLSLNILI